MLYPASQFPDRFHMNPLSAFYDNERLPFDAFSKAIKTVATFAIMAECRMQTQRQ